MFFDLRNDFRQEALVSFALLFLPLLMRSSFASVLVSAFLFSSFVPLVSARTPWANWHPWNPSSSAAGVSSAVSSVASSKAAWMPIKRKVGIGESQRKALRRKAFNVKKHMTPEGRKKD